MISNYDYFSTTSDWKSIKSKNVETWFWMIYYFILFNSNEKKYTFSPTCLKDSIFSNGMQCIFNSYYINHSLDNNVLLDSWFRLHFYIFWFIPCSCSWISFLKICSNQRYVCLVYSIHYSLTEIFIFLRFHFILCSTKWTVFYRELFERFVFEIVSHC